MCGEIVPSNFDSCWSCGSGHDGILEVQVTEAPAEIHDLGSSPLSSDQSESNVDGLPCAVCGSLKILPNVRVCDQGEHSSGSLRLVVYGDPNALIFKDRRYGEITARVCGECGHVELRVPNAANLYRHYLESQR
jgi:hypothetical protein